MPRVLVVDDDRAMVRTLCDVLALRGWTPTGVHSGEAAISAVESETFDAVVMDIRMSGMDGVRALKAMRAARPGIRVVLMTAFTAAAMIKEAEREGALRVLAKPVQLPDLLKLLDETLAAPRPVLVVDDDAAFLQTLSDALRSRGRTVITATRLDEAVDRLIADAPTAVVLHLRLDSVEPKDSILAIRGVSPAILLVLYSGHPLTLDATIRTLPTDWIHACLRKPFDVDALLTLLDHGRT
jgi:two-component system NtrC family response regulator/two-component system nitrogen regulation response regulator GlnG